MTTTRFAARLVSLGLSATLTLAMLGSVNLIATAQPAPAALMAAAAAPAA